MGLRSYPDGKGEVSYHDRPTSRPNEPPFTTDPGSTAPPDPLNPVEEVTAKMKDVLGS
jgi:hypothetical protein